MRPALVAVSTSLSDRQSSVACARSGLYADIPFLVASSPAAYCEAGAASDAWPIGNLWRHMRTTVGEFSSLQVRRCAALTLAVPNLCHRWAEIDVGKRCNWLIEKDISPSTAAYERLCTL